MRWGSREERREVTRELAYHERARDEELILGAVRASGSGEIKRLRVRAAPRLSGGGESANACDAWIHLSLLRVVMDAIAVGWFAYPIAPLLLSIFAMLPFTVSKRTGQPYGFWFAVSTAHVFFDAVFARWASCSLNIFAACCCCYGIRSG